MWKSCAHNPQASALKPESRPSCSALPHTRAPDCFITSHWKSMSGKLENSLANAERQNPVRSAFGDLVGLQLAEDAGRFISATSLEPPYLSRCCGCSTTRRAALNTTRVRHPSHFQTVAAMQRISMCQCASPWCSHSLVAIGWMVVGCVVSFGFLCALGFSVLMLAALCLCAVQQHLAGWWCDDAFSQKILLYTSGLIVPLRKWQSISLLCASRTLPFFDQLLGVLPVKLPPFLQGIWMVLHYTHGNHNQLDILAIF